MGLLRVHVALLRPKDISPVASLPGPGGNDTIDDVLARTRAIGGSASEGILDVALDPGNSIFIIKG